MLVSWRVVKLGIFNLPKKDRVEKTNSSKPEAEKPKRT